MERKDGERSLKLKLARQYFKKALTLKRDDPESNFRCAQLLFQLGNYASAEEYFLRSLEYDSTQYECLVDYATFLYQLGKIQEAQKFFQRASHFQSESHSGNAHKYLLSVTNQHLISNFCMF